MHLYVLCMGLMCVVSDVRCGRCVLGEGGVGNGGTEERAGKVCK